MTEQESGDDYIRSLASFIRQNEPRLAQATFTRPRRTQQSTSLFAWITPEISPLVLSTDTHHLFYLLMRFEALGYDIGTLDVVIDSPSRPMNYPNLFPERNHADASSLASFRSSLSAVSKLSLGGGWWNRVEPPTPDAELKYLFSTFTKIPALSIHGPSRKVIFELLNDGPNRNAVPLDVFKNLQSLECQDVDPRTLLGWDRLAESLRSLKVRRSGMEDVSQIFKAAVLHDESRREYEPLISFHSTPLPSTIDEDESQDPPPSDEKTAATARQPHKPLHFSSLKWAFLKHLYLPDNGLTLFPTDILQYLCSVTHLDLSSNLLVSIPSGLGALYNLLSLNLADNLIDSVLGIYLNLGQILYLNLSHNRLESLCGLERLLALERADLRYNLLEESAEIGRLASLPHISQIWVDGNPFVDFEDAYRVAIFDHFRKSGSDITLDGTRPGFYEKRSLGSLSLDQVKSDNPLPTSYSPPVIAVGHHRSLSSAMETGTMPLNSSLISVSYSPPGSKAMRKKSRIVELEQSLAHGLKPASMKAEGQSDNPIKGKQLVGEHTRATLLSRSQHDVSPNELIPPTTAAPSSLPTTHPDTKPSNGQHSERFLLVHAHSRSHTDEPLHISGGELGSSRSFSRSALRQARLSASVSETPTPPGLLPGTVDPAHDNIDEYRKRIEGLQKDMGDGWLKVYSQSQMKSPTR